MGLIFDNCVSLSALRQRQRQGAYGTLAWWLVLVSVGLPPTAVTIAGLGLGPGITVGRAVLFAALGWYALWLIYIVLESCNPLALSVREGTFGQWVATGISPGLWVVGSLESFLFDSLLLTITQVPAFAVVWVLGGASVQSIGLCTGALWLMMLNLCFVGILFWRRPITALLTLLVMSTATVLSIILLCRGFANADRVALAWLAAAGSPSPVELLAVLTAGPWLSPRLVAILGSELPLGSLRFTAVELFFASNAVLVGVQFLAAAAGSRSSILPHAVEDLITRRGRVRSDDGAAGVRTRHYGMAVAIRLFQENRGRVWRVCEDAVVMVAELGVFAIGLAYFLSTGLALMSCLDHLSFAVVLYGVILAGGAIACGGTSCFRGAGLLYRPRPRGWWRAPFWSLIAALSKGGIVSLAALVGVLVLCGPPFGSSVQWAASTFPVLIPAFVVFCICVGMLFSTLRGEQLLAVRDTVVVLLGWLLLPLLVILLVQFVFPMFSFLLRIASLSPLLPLVISQLEDGKMFHRVSDGTMMVTTLTLKTDVFLWALGVISALCLGVALLRMVVLTRRGGGNS